MTTERPLSREDHLVKDRIFPVLPLSLSLGCTAFPCSSFSYVIPQSPYLQIRPFDTQSTAQILQSHSSIPPLQLILEHELNNNSWQNPDPSSDADLFLASLYVLEGSLWVLALRIHTSVCDRAATAALLSELVAMMEEKEGNRAESMEENQEMEVSLGIEDCRARRLLWGKWRLY
ncbi:hypothetical protein SASPL_117464 [Salvia splendens]|uniref:Uncharacterized protein n=1 Tax=Salvia splendens TaxID=180675 RepID=A0A8X8XXK9_SALSN|nr:hypothetical protein SASPL_117464 [Salvia splendens]